MVRLRQIQGEVGTTRDYILSTQDLIANRTVRNIYRIKARQIGATLGELHLYGRRGASIATIDILKFTTPDEAQELPAAGVREDSTPIYRVANYSREQGVSGGYPTIGGLMDGSILAAETSVASVDLIIQYDDAPI